MSNSNEILNYLSDYRFAIFIRIAVQINTKAFFWVRFARKLGKTGNNETKNKGGGGAMDGGDSKGRVINKKHTILGESDLICL